MTTIPKSRQITDDEDTDDNNKDDFDNNKDNVDNDNDKDDGYIKGMKVERKKIICKNRGKKRG